MIGYALADRARRTRLVTVSHALAVALNTTPSAYFPAKLVPPQSPKSTTEAGPRDGAARSRLVYSEVVALAAASRVFIHGGEEWELLSDPRPVRVGNQVTGYEAECLAVEVLYPREGDLMEQGGEAVDESGDSGLQPLTVPCSLYQPDDERSGDRGTFKDYRAEAPIEFVAQLEVKNRSLAFGAESFKIVSAVPNYEIPHVALTLRRA